MDHRRLVTKVRAMISHAGDTSNLILDPDLDSYYLMDVTLLALPQMQDRLATTLLQGETCLRRGAISSADRGQFKVYAAMLQEADVDRALSSAHTALDSDQAFYGTSESLQRRLPTALEKFSTAAKAFVKLTARLGDGETTDVGPDEYVAAGDAARRASRDLWKVAVDELDVLLQTRINHFHTRRASSLLLAALAFTAAISLVTYITRSISRPLQRQANELRHANEAIQQSEHRARAIVEAAPDCVITMDGTGRIVEFNHAAQRMFGYGHEAAVGRVVADLIVPVRYRDAHMQGLRRFLQTGVGAVLGRRIELAGLRADGSELPIELAVSVVAREGAPTFIAFISDITQRKKSEDELKRLFAETELLLASIPSVLIHLDPAGTITRWNAAAESVFGLRAADAIGRCCRSLPWSDASIPLRLEELAGRFGAEQLAHVVVTRSDGAERILDLTASPICADGQCTGLLVLGNDQTEQARLELSLRQSQKLESIGQMAAGIAHEINTPMQFVSDNIGYLSDCAEWLFKVVEAYERNLDKSGAHRSWEVRCDEINKVIQTSDFGRIRKQVPTAIAESKEGIERVIDIVRAMKEFSHPGGTKTMSIDLNEAIRSAAAISRNRWKYVADLELLLDPELPHLDCFPAEINQMLLNLIVNAGDAIADKVGAGGDARGGITVRTRRDVDQIVIEIEDTGCGIPDEIRGRIFDPFFTTKDVGKGTGQGLAICYNVVVNMHRGTIGVESTAGVGACFSVAIPFTGQLRANDSCAAASLSETTGAELPIGYLPAGLDRGLPITELPALSDCIG